MHISVVCGQTSMVVNKEVVFLLISVSYTKIVPCSSVLCSVSYSNSTTSTFLFKFRCPVAFLFVCLFVFNVKYTALLYNI